MIGVYRYLNFFTPDECKKIISVFYNNTKLHQKWSNNTDFVDLGELNYSFDLSNRLTNHIEKTHNVKLNYTHIVKWPDGGQMDKHKDGDWYTTNDYTCICYLNVDYKGGRTYIIENNIDYYLNVYEQGTYTFFNSKQIEHGVEKLEGTRYTLTSWYSKNV